MGWGGAGRQAQRGEGRGQGRGGQAGMEKQQGRRQAVGEKGPVAIATQALAHAQLLCSRSSLPLTSCRDEPSSA